MSHPVHVLRRARREYQFGLPEADSERCATCTAFGEVWKGDSVNCSRLHISIANSKRSRCELHTPEASGVEASHYEATARAVARMVPGRRTWADLPQNQPFERTPLAAPLD